MECFRLKICITPPELKRCLLGVQAGESGHDPIQVRRSENSSAVDLQASAGGGHWPHVAPLDTARAPELGTFLTPFILLTG